MTPFGLSWKKKKEEKRPVSAPISEQRTILEDMCGNDKELYEALSRTIMLNPESAVKEGVDSFVGKGQEYEKTGDNIKARIAYQAAGEVSLYEGRLAQAQKFFKKATEVDPQGPYKKVFDFYGKKENAERASTIAREFYIKTGKLKAKET